MNVSDNIIITDSDPVELAIRKALSQPPARVGSRLTMEENLAQKFHVPRNRIRKVLAELTKSGFLMRRRGSGTYIRRLPPPPVEVELSQPSPFTQITAHELIDSVETTSGKHSARPSPWRVREGRLELSLWSNLDSSAITAQHVLQGLVGRAEELGHRLNLRSMVGRDNALLPADVLARRLENDDSDGHLVLHSWASRLLSSMPNAERPVVVFEAASCGLDYDHVIYQDTHEAVSRGLVALRQSGFERIGYIGAAYFEFQTNLQREAYRYAMRGMGLSHDRATVLSSFALADTAAIAEQIRQFLSGDNRPDSIYVGDDFLIPGLIEATESLNLVPGRDLGVIILSNRGQPLPQAPHQRKWSCMEFDPVMFGRSIVNMLVDCIEHGSESVGSVSIHARWIAGDTHLKS